MEIYALKVQPSVNLLGAPDPRLLAYSAAMLAAVYTEGLMK